MAFPIPAASAQGGTGTTDALAHPITVGQNVSITSVAFTHAA